MGWEMVDGDCVVECDVPWLDSNTGNALVAPQWVAGEWVANLPWGLRLSE